MIKLLIGGSPCTRWSIAQKNNRETTAEGIGWELFKNFLIAKEKFNPDFFLYENNKSAAQAIKDQIAKELGVYDGTIFMEDTGVRMTHINSALVSAQNRQRFYVTNFGDIEQPEDRGILLRDILESGTAWREKSYCVDANYFKASNGTEPFTGRQSGDRLQVAEPIYQTLTSGELEYLARADMNQRFINEANGNKSHCVTANFSKGVPYNVLAEPVCVAQRGRYDGTGTRSHKNDAEIDQHYEAREDGKTNALTTVSKDNAIAELVEPPACLRYERTDYAKEIRKGYEDGTIEERMCNLREWHPREDDKSNTLTTVLKDNMIIDTADGKHHPIYEVRNGYITIKDKRYPIKLRDGYYIIRKLTVTECCRLQTMPDDYCRAVSATQGYKGLGNGWTAEVIIHLLNHALRDIPRNEPITVLSMYDGIGTGRYCLDKMGFTNVAYNAYEIDKYAMQMAMSNYPDIIQCGDAFQLRQAEWQIRRAA